MLACGSGAIVDDKALLGFRGASGLLWPASLGNVCLVVITLRAVRNAVESVLMLVVIVKVGTIRRGACKRAAGAFWGADGVAGTAVGDVKFANSLF